MKNKIGAIMAIAAITVLSSCGSSEYDKGYNAGYADGIKSFSDGYAKGYEEGMKNTTEAVTLYGDFTATVRQLIPDYSAGDTINRAAVITLFQDDPKVIRLNEDVCSEIQVGETYTFEVFEEEVVLPVSQLSDDNIVSSNISLDRLYIKNYRTPVEDEYGLVCWRVKYK